MKIRYIRTRRAIGREAEKFKFLEYSDYDYETSGIDYNKGILRKVEGTHFVRSTEEEFDSWVLH